MKEQIKLKETIKNHESLLERFNEFASIENMDHYKNVYVPFIENFIGQIKDLETSNKNVRECIVKFDQDISLKCNKSALQTFKFELNRDFMNVSLHPILEGQIKDVARTAQEME